MEYRTIKEQQFILGLIKFEELPEESRNKDALVFQALSIDVNNIDYVSENLKNNEDFIIKILNYSKFSTTFNHEVAKKRLIENMNDDLKRDKSFIKKILYVDINMALKIMKKDKDLYEDEDLWSDILMHNGVFLDFAPDLIKNNLDLAKIAVKERAKAYLYIGEELRNNVELAILLCETEIYSITVVDNSIINFEFADALKHLYFSDKNLITKVNKKMEEKMHIMKEILERHSREENLYSKLEDTNENLVAHIKKKI